VPVVLFSLALALALTLTLTLTLTMPRRGRWSYRACRSVCAGGWAVAR
jgi:hypothetical protein